MYSQANVRVESVLRPPTRALPSVIVDTEKVLREADGPTKAHGPEASNAWWVERCSPRAGCASKPDGESREEPEEHKRFGSHTFVPISWMCKKQTAVSRSSTESEIISLDT